MSGRTRWIFATLCTASLGLASLAIVISPRVFAGDQNGGMMRSDKRDIIDTATGPGMQKVTTVVTAIKAAGLVDALKSEGPFTVFAPTNDAFDKLPKGTVEDLLKPENKDKLTQILLYHVHKGDAIMARDVKTMNLSTLQGSPLMVKTDGDGNVWINNAKVIKTDVVCSNGVIHWIDTVVMPPSDK